MFSLTIIGGSKWLKSCNSLQLNLLNSSFLLLSLQGMVKESINIGGSHIPPSGLFKSERKWIMLSTSRLM